MEGRKLTDTKCMRNSMITMDNFYCAMVRIKRTENDSLVLPYPSIRLSKKQVNPMLVCLQEIDIKLKNGLHFIVSHAETSLDTGR